MPQLSFSSKVNPCLLAAVIIWASAFIAIRIGLQGYSPDALALFRYIIASLTIASIYFRLAKHASINLADLIRMVVVGIFGIAIYNVALNYAEINLPGGIASFIVSQSPIFTALLSWLFLKEKLSIFAWLGFIISFFGILLIAIAETHTIKFNFYIVCALISALAGALYIVLQKPLLKRISGLEFTAIAIWGATLSMLFYLPEVVHQIKNASWQATTAAIYLGIFPGAIGYALWSIGLKEIPASRAVSYIYLMPIFATIMGLGFGEIPKLLSVVGGLIALLGAIIVNRSK